MTHDELLADIKKSCPDKDICKNCCALLAVVELCIRAEELKITGIASRSSVSTEFLLLTIEKELG